MNVVRLNILSIYVKSTAHTDQGVFLQWWRARERILHAMNMINLGIRTDAQNYIPAIYNKLKVNIV